jgi:hypothetical protein
MRDVESTLDIHGFGFRENGIDVREEHELFLRYLQRGIHLWSLGGQYPSNTEGKSTISAFCEIL